MTQLRRAMLSLARYSRWPRDELRALNPDEFADYLQTAIELLEEVKDAP